MTYEEKRKELDNYNPLDYYGESQYVDAADTTQNWLTAKITAVIGSEVQVTYDGWPARWDAVSYSSLMHPARVWCLTGGESRLVASFSRYCSRDVSMHILSTADQNICSGTRSVRGR